MNQTAMQVLEFDKIIKRVEEYAISDLGKELVRKMHPSIELPVVEGWLQETTEARAIVDKTSRVPLHSLQGMQQILTKVEKALILQAEDLENISRFLAECKRLKKFMADHSMLGPRISAYALSIDPLEEIEEEINRCICGGRVEDKASTELSKLRKKIEIAEDRIKRKLHSILQSPDFGQYAQDQLVSMRDGRYVLPVKREYRKNIEGSVLDSSSSGSTVFIEPLAVKKLQDELNLLRIEEEKEVYKILSYLTASVGQQQKELSINTEAMAHYDFLLAKAKYSKEIEGISVHVNTRKYVHIKGAKHPLIGKKATPLDFTIGEDYSGLIITGPNTGGKTVALKTIGLLTLMVQSGMHVPVQQGSEFSIFLDVLVDIGDGQSIEHSLSTFSSHIKNIISILECAGENSLVIIDELGTGTDPGEGMGLAISVLEEIHSKKSTLIVSTHYNEIKNFATGQQGFENGHMEFDIHTLKPLYRLKIGQAGDSNAFLIALKLGMHPKTIERAHEITYKEKKEYKALQQEIEILQTKNEEVIEAHQQQMSKFMAVEEKSKNKKIEQSFQIGDCVWISSLKRTGIVCEMENKRGEVTVMIMNKKMRFNKKLLSIYIDNKELYPENYDFDIVFESKENRKKQRIMGKRHVEGLSISREDKEK